jgi:hypothetical protein
MEQEAVLAAHEFFLIFPFGKRLTPPKGPGRRSRGTSADASAAQRGEGLSAGGDEGCNQLQRGEAIFLPSSGEESCFQLSAAGARTVEFGAPICKVEVHKLHMVGLTHADKKKQVKAPRFKKNFSAILAAVVLLLCCCDVWIPNADVSRAQLLG